MFSPEILSLGGVQFVPRVRARIQIDDHRVGTRRDKIVPEVVCSRVTVAIERNDLVVNSQSKLTCVTVFLSFVKHIR